jgi:hypothetical protein
MPVIRVMDIRVTDFLMDALSAGWNGLNHKKAS